MLTCYSDAFAQKIPGKGQPRDADLGRGTRADSLGQVKRASSSLWQTAERSFRS